MAEGNMNEVLVLLGDLSLGLGTNDVELTKTTVAELNKFTFAESAASSIIDVVRNRTYGPNVAEMMNDAYFYALENLDVIPDKEFQKIYARSRKALELADETEMKAILKEAVENDIPTITNKNTVLNFVSILYRFCTRLNDYVSMKAIRDKVGE
ncbi:MAG: hypothetical protein NC114_06790 [Ruminococcus flavefaciens]|nr:hypothetical protein [Ruminococcus flavefaciens]